MAGFGPGLIFGLDRVAYPKLRGAASTLFFPLLYTSFDFLLNLTNPFGTLGVLGYSQIDFPMFAQLASITGLWGPTFMITWFGSIMVWVWTQPGRAGRPLLLAYGCLLAGVLAFGAVRLTMPKAESVLVAGIHVHDRDKENKAFWEALHVGDRAAADAISESVLAKLLEETELAARSGAKIVVWSELSPYVLFVNEDRVLARIAEASKRLGIYLIASPYIASMGSKTPENKAVMFDPEGRRALSHLKFGGNFLEGTVPGDRALSTVESVFGTLSAIVCWDADFPSHVIQAGQKGVDILFIPSSDWRAIDPAHTDVAVFRGIENGCSIVRQTQNGRSIMTDACGRELASMDHFEPKPGARPDPGQQPSGSGDESQSWRMFGRVPIRGTFALYPRIGDLFGWLSFAGLALVSILALRPKRQDLP